MTNTTDIFADDFSNNDELIRRLEHDTQVLKSDRVKNAFKAVDRKDFVKGDYSVEAYEDYPLPIGEDQTISQPTTVAFMLELLDVKEGHAILDVGSGSGWTTALLAELVGKNGTVIGLEVKDALVEFGQNNVGKYDYPQVEIRKSTGGAPHLDEAPFDRILISAAVNEIPDAFITQLKDNGIIVLPVQNSVVKVTKVPHTKEKGYELEEETYDGFRFVPFEGEE